MHKPKDTMTNTTSGHTFYIPVMGSAFTIDTPLMVAKYGISSVISLVDDVLIEQMRKLHSEKIGELYEPVLDKSHDSRARRITLYLNFVNKLVKKQINAMKDSPFVEGSDLIRYYELLPEGSAKRLYRKMVYETNADKKKIMQNRLRSLVIPGSIDVNIMTKLDRDNYIGREKLAPEFSDALAALRGFAQSDLQSSIVFSAGMNLRLYSYITTFDDFFPDEDGNLTKKVVLKVSDFRSAEIQGKFLAKRGVWVSEYRIESGLNCGGHAFPTAGNLLGPVLNEFKLRKTELTDKLFTFCNKALSANDRNSMDSPLPVKITVQGGIGTHDEHELLRDQYEVDSTGWGTPFLLVPEVTNVDISHLNKLTRSTEQDVYLSNSSPLGVPFWNLKNSESETKRLSRIDAGRPGSPCPKGFLASNTEFTNIPICHASRGYQRRKVKQLDSMSSFEDHRPMIKDEVLSKSCICHDLGGSVKVKHGIETDKTHPAICPGPNIVNFSRTATLEEMVNHIYGRFNKLINPERPHIFERELTLYMNYLKDEIENFAIGLSTRKQSYFDEFKQNLQDGIEHYTELPQTILREKWDSFLEELKTLYEDVEALTLDPIATS